MASTSKNVKADVKAVKEGSSIKEFQLRDIIRKALQSDNPLLQKALKQEQAFRAKTENELLALFATLQAFMGERDETEKEAIKSATLERLNRDLELVTRLNTALEAYRPKDIEPRNYTADDHNTCSYPAKFNKMALAIPGAKTLISAHFRDIFCDGTLPTGYSFQSLPKDVTILADNPFSIYGDSKGTFLKTAALNVLLSCTGNIRLQQVFGIDESALVHVTALPLNLNLTKLDERFSQFTYSFSDSVSSPFKLSNGLTFIHSGYAFGGHRDTASRYTGGTKLFGPEDCSSWIAKFCDSPTQFSTLDQLYIYRLSVLKNFQHSIGVVPAEYSSTPIASTMTDLFDPILVKDPQKDIRPGQIYAHRSYDLTTDAAMKGPGTRGGHTGLVLDFISSGKDSSVAIMAYRRNMPQEEGFGVQAFPFAPENGRVMLFSAKSQAASRHAKKEDEKVFENALANTTIVGVSTTNAGAAITTAGSTVQNIAANKV